MPLTAGTLGRDSPARTSLPRDHLPPSQHRQPVTAPTAYGHGIATTQTTVHDIHTSPDDFNVVLDRTTAPRRLLMTSSEWESNIRPAPPRNGNMETEPVEEISHIGSYALSIVPNRYRTALVCVHDIVAAGHVVIFTHHETIVSDVGSV